MNQPGERGARIDGQRFKRWMASFVGYSKTITNHTIEMWLDQFATADKDLAARVLDAVHFVNVEKIRASYSSQLNSLSGWNIDSKKRRGNWYFVPFSRSAGESGDAMLHQFRIATGMGKAKFNPLFIYKSDLVSKKMGPNDTVVFIDDFSGTGGQACKSWKEIFSELLTGGPRVILLLVAATTEAVGRIKSDTDMEPVYELVLDDRDNIFDKACTHFNSMEKKSLLGYCSTAYAATPKGWGEKGLVFVLAHRCPNNSIPILHSDHKDWLGLFPRQ